MPAIDMDALLAPCSTSAACGEDLEYEQEFQAVMVASAAPAEGMLGPATAHEIDWRDIMGRVAALFDNTLDLRLAVLLVRAATHVDGLHGLAKSLALLQTLVERHWEGIHPRLDADLGNNPTMRVNALKELTDPAFLAALQRVPLVSVANLGSVSMRTLVGSDLADDDPPPATIVTHCDLDLLRAAVTDATQARASTEVLQRAFNERVAPQFAVSLEDLAGVLGRMERALAERLSERAETDGSQAAVHNGGPDTACDGGASGASSGSSAFARAPVLAEIRSRADVIRILESVCSYYERAEPSSPVPILLKRACRLVPMTFEEIVSNLTPSAIKELDAVRGPGENSS